MKKLNKAQVATILIGGFFVIILFVAPKVINTVDNNSEITETTETPSETAEHAHSHDLKEGITLAAEEQEKLDNLETKLKSSKSSAEKLNILDSLINFASSVKQPVLMASYFKEKAEILNTELAWIQAGDVFFKSYRFAENKSHVLIEEAVNSYEKVLEINPSNMQAKTALGVCYVEGAAELGEMPMKGIGILKEVLEVDSNNVDALINLGYFSIKSTQYDAAIERFEKVLEIDPENAEAFLYLTDIYVQKGEIDKGVLYLEKYKSFQDDQLVIQQVNDYIDELKRSTDKKK